LSAKHKKSIIGNVLESNVNEIMPKLCLLKYTCENCEKNLKIVLDYGNTIKNV
jgi:hypothetical protein